MSNLRNTKFTFGFLNNAQDGTNIKKHEATIAKNLDPDLLALGTLQKENIVFSTASDPAPALAGTSFRVGPTPSFKPQAYLQSVLSGTPTWFDVDFLFYTKTITATATTSVAPTVALVDGLYSYVVLPVAVVDGWTIMGQPSAVATAKVETTVPANPGVVSLNFAAPASNETEVWVFRRGPDDPDFIRIARVTTAGGNTVYLGDGTSVASSAPHITYVDSLRVSSIIDAYVLESEGDESMASIQAAIGNTNAGFSEVFVKDGRLWAVPVNRPDLLLYSRAGAWWGWQRNNSFSFDANITGIEVVKDPDSVGGELLTLVFTDDGIFHLKGNGTSASPYILQKAVQDVKVLDGSVVDMNGVVMFMTNCTKDFNTIYDTQKAYNYTNYGRKVYEYDTKSLVEVSARVQNDPMFADVNLSAPVVDMSIQYAKLSGGDKYIVQRAGTRPLPYSGAYDSLVYHKDAAGWVTRGTFSESRLEWQWASGWFTPDVLQRFKIEYSRFLKFDYEGYLILNFYVQSGDALVQAAPSLTLAASEDRKEMIVRMPTNLGRRWMFELKGKSYDLTSPSRTIMPVLYGMYFVR